MEVNNTPVKVGDILYGSLTYPYNSLYNTKPYKVAKVGRKFLYFEHPNDEYPISIEKLRWVSLSSSLSSQFYRSLEEIEQTKEYNEKSHELRKFFDWSGKSKASL